METAEIARKALDILDRDGWCKGSFTKKVNLNILGGSQGSHCIGGIWSLAQGSACWLEEKEYEVLLAKIKEQYPACDFVSDNYFISRFGSAIQQVAFWNDSMATEADVRAILEKLAAS